MKRGILVIVVMGLAWGLAGAARGEERAIRSAGDFRAAFADAGVAEKSAREMGLVGHVGMLARSDSAEVRAAAKRMVEVLGRYKVDVPGELKGIEVGEIAKVRGEMEWRELAKMGRVVESMAKIWLEKDHGQPAGLGREIFEDLARNGPGACVRVMGAGFLSTAATGPLGEMRIYEAVPVEVAKVAWDGAMEASLDVSSGALEWDAAAYLGLTAIGWGTAIEMLERVDSGGSEKEIREVMERRVARVEKLVAVAEKADTSKEAGERLEMLKKAVEYVSKRVGPLAEWIVSRREMEAALRAFVAAVNKEDRAEAEKYVTRAAGERLRKGESLRDVVGNAKGVKEVRLGKLGSLGQSGEVRELECELIVVDGEGKQTKRQSELPFRKLDGRWVMGRE